MQVKVGEDLGIKALVFDVAGTLIDWHGAVYEELTRFGTERGLERNWAEVTNAWTWRAAELLALRPNQLVMVVAHNGDLLAAKAEGFRIAFIVRPLEQGAGLTPTPEPDPAIDIVANDAIDLAVRLGA
jgi:beta-phosphoglucomutase-like phosphatase (HAD superfamily)